jgi:ribose transport system permease protein
MSRSSGRSRFISLLAIPEFGVVVALVVVSGIFQSFNKVFLTKDVLVSIISAVTFVAIIAVGQSILLISGQFDLSVGAVAGLSAVVSGKLMTSIGWNVPLAIIAGLVFGTMMGLINGLMVTRIGVPAFIQTLGMLFVAQGLTQLIGKGFPIYPLPSVVTGIGAADLFAGLGWSAAVLIVFTIAGDVLTRRMVIGRNLYVIGGNAEVARIVGIDYRKYQLAAFGLTGFLSAVSGLLLMATLTAATPTLGSGWELIVIAGTVVGGVSLFGGVGTVFGAVLGVLLIQVVQSGLITSGLNPNLQNVAVGTILVVAVTFDVMRRRLRLSPKSKNRKEVKGNELPIGINQVGQSAKEADPKRQLLAGG